MALSRVKTWASGEVLTAADQNAEFNNILNNALALISPLTGNLDFDLNQAIELVCEKLGSAPTNTTGRLWYRTDTELLQYGGASAVKTLVEIAATQTLTKKTFQAGAGTVSAPTISFDADTDTGLYNSAANTVDVAVGGVRAARFNTVASGVNFVDLTPGATGDAVDVAAAGSDTDARLNLKSKGTKPVSMSFAAATATANLLGVANLNTTAGATTATTSEETLISYSLPGNALNVNGRAIRVRAWGTTAANANTKTVRLKFGATTLVSRATSTSGVHWVVEGLVVRTGSNTQDGYGSILYGTENINTVNFTTATETDSGGISVALTGQNGTASANDIVAEGMMTEVLN